MTPKRTGPKATTATTIAELPRTPAIYVMYGGEQPRWAAYVGVAGDLRERVTQHLVKRDSSVTTGTAAVGLNPEHIREIEWWEHNAFDDRIQLEGAELVAFDVFEPALRSRGRPGAAALNLYSDEGFSKEIRQLLEGAPSGRLVLPSLPALIERVIELEERVASLEARSAVKG